MASKKPTAKTPAAAKTSPELEVINALARILNETGLSEIELDQKGTRFRVSKALTAVATVAAPAAVPAHAHHAPAAGPATTAPAAKPAGDHPGTVKSPMVPCNSMVSTATNSPRRNLSTSAT